MWKFWKNKKYTIQDLNITGSSYSHAQRERFKIAFIDDEDFVYQSRLANLGFRINKYEDVQDLNMLSSYDIIISDIRGVGKSFNSEAEGAFLLHELKRTICCRKNTVLRVGYFWKNDFVVNNYPKYEYLKFSINP